ncbi:MAG: tyrosine-type recombinase/integrase, partial [Chloroflexia bacterium]|nr:tyrosine-type recombinase/integrase [Chloroflexia bacterium]
QRGNSLTSRMVELVVQKCAEMAGLEDEGITPHSLRHTFAASYLEQNPGELVELQALLGHSSLDTTAIYAQSSFKDVARKLERSSLNVER